MRMSARISATVMVLAVAIGGVVGGPDAFAVNRSRAAAPSTQDVPMQDAVVYLKSHADLAGARTGGRRDRPGRIERALRAHATLAQRPILDLLARRRAAQQVSTVEPLWIANAVAVRATPRVLSELARRPEVASVAPDVLVAAPAPGAASVTTAGPVEPNIGTVNAPALWDRGFRGQGVVIASMDTGVDATHPDLSANWRGGGNSWFDPNGQHATPTDVSGHGTQTMGVMVGRSAGGSAIGMAPDARWIAVKIFNDRGVTTTTMIHRGFQWLLDPDGHAATADAPDIVNSSWSLSTAGCVLDFQPDLQSLRAAGILPVFAAGNAGPSAGTVLSPANNPEALAVGATDNSDGLYPYSGRGPSPCTGATSPGLVAPGTSVRTADLYAGYVSDTGTSVAAPEVSGAAALLLSAVPALTPDQQSAALTTTAVDLGPAGPDNDTGSGRLDTLAAYQWVATTPDFSLTATPGTVTISGGGTATFDVTSAGVNGFAGDVALTVTGLPDQATAVLAPATVTGGSGTSRLTVTTTAQVVPGNYPVTVAGTGGSLTRTTTLTLVVQGPPDFAIQVSPATQSVPAGGSAAYQVALASINGFVGDETLTVTGLPAAVGTASVAPSVISTVGSAVLTVSTLGTAAPGTYQLQVTGASGTISHSTTLTLTVTAPPDFAVTASPTTRSVAAGSTAGFSVSVAPANGFSAPVTLALTGLPAAVGTAGFSPAVITGSGASQLTVSTAGTAAAGTYSLTITGTSGGLARTATVTLAVTRPDFTIAVSPSSATVSRGQAASYQVSIGAVGGFTGSVNVTTAGTPSGSTTSVTPVAVAVPGTATVRVSTGWLTKRGTFTVVITGKAGGLVRQQTVTLTVR
ncbi:MAG TPA: S8 family serine peptidase [Nakamurella sp.]|jgi:subtilisin family serine protease